VNNETLLTGMLNEFRNQTVQEVAVIIQCDQGQRHETVSKVLATISK